MTGVDFERHGRALLGNGYLIIPIKPGHKRPAIERWQHARLGAADLTRYPGHGVGVLCGQGAHPLVALDVDTTDEALAERFVAWCRERLGPTCERIGKAPKALLVYRAERAGLGKAASAWFDDLAGGRHRLEALGRGQQFVAYHIHPDTGEPYAWVDIFGGLELMRAVDLPVVTVAQIEEAIFAFERMAEEAGMSRAEGSRASGCKATAEDGEGEDPLMAYEPPLGLALEEAQRLLAPIDNEDYDTWLKAGMALHHEFDGSDEARALWDAWSSTASNYAGSEDIAARWASFGKGSQTPVTARWLLRLTKEETRAAALQEKRLALDEARALIERCEDSIVLLGEVARKAGDAAGSDIALKAELESLIRARFKALTGATLSSTDARAAMEGGRKVTALNTDRRRPLTEFGNADRMLDHYGEGLMYVPEIDTWYMWTGVYWRKAADVEVEHLAVETVRALIEEAKALEDDAMRSDYLKFCAVSQKAAMVRSMVTIAKTSPRVIVSVEDLDNQPGLLGVANGVVDLATGKLLAPDPAYRITAVTAAEYDPDASCPLFERTVREVFFDDEEMIGFFRRLIGYSLLGQPREDVLVIPYGCGANGKSTVLGAIRDALGGHARTAAAETFLRSGPAAGGGSAREDVLRLRGARFVYVAEPDEGSELKEGFVKAMTGGEPLPARGLYAKATVEVKPTWVAFMPTNHKPIVKGDDHAIWRRLMMVPFMRNFDEDPVIAKDPARKELLPREAKGILAWCVRGALEYQRVGLAPPEAVRQAGVDYRSDMDLLSEWIEECCETGRDCVESTSQLWASWEAYARSRGELRYIPTAKSLGRRLAGRGFEAIRDAGGLRGRGFRGIRVRAVEGVL